MSNEYFGEVKIELPDPVGRVIKTYNYTKHSILFNEQLEFFLYDHISFHLNTHPLNTRL
jgi:hypothetical protein